MEYFVLSNPRPNSVFVEPENIYSYVDNYDRYSKKSSRKGFNKAIEECQRFYKDPEVKMHFTQYVNRLVFATHKNFIIEIQ